MHALRILNPIPSDLFMFRGTDYWALNLHQLKKKKEWKIEEATLTQPAFSLYLKYGCGSSQTTKNYHTRTVYVVLLSQITIGESHVCGIHQMWERYSICLYYILFFLLRCTQFCIITQITTYEYTFIQLF